MKTRNLPVTRSVVRWSAYIILVMLLFSAWAWMRLPEGAQMPVHWNAAGEIDRYGTKFEGLLLLPVISGLIAVTLAFIPLFEPRQGNLLRSAKPYVITCAATLLFMLCLHAAMILTALGKPVSVPRAIFAATGVLFIVIGNFFGKVRSNYFFGIRTPWTLSSELSWNKTHRLGGRLFMLFGLVVLLTGLLASEQAGLTVLLGGLVLVTIVVSVYSYQVWKSDPDKRPKDG